MQMYSNLFHSVFSELGNEAESLLNVIHQTAWNNTPKAISGSEATKYSKVIK